MNPEHDVEFVHHVENAGRPEGEPVFKCVMHVVLGASNTLVPARSLHVSLALLPALNECCPTVAAAPPSTHRLTPALPPPTQNFLNLHAHTYVRLDGATKPEQRQILTQRFNSDPKLFCFILSTRRQAPCGVVWGAARQEGGAAGVVEQGRELRTRPHHPPVPPSCCVQRRRGHEPHRSRHGHLLRFRRVPGPPACRSRSLCCCWRRCRGC